MKVNFSSRMDLYSKMQAERATTVKGNFPSGKTDIAEFSRGTGTGLDKELTSAKNTIQSDIYSATSPDRLEQLKLAIKTGNYHVSTDDMVKAILSE